MRTIQPSSFNVYSINELIDVKAKEKAIENIFNKEQWEALRGNSFITIIFDVLICG